MRYGLHGVLLLILALVQVACVTEPQPPVTEYALSPRIQAQGANDGKLPLVLKLAPVSASQIYMSTDILYVGDDYQRNPYAYSRWVDSPVHMLQLVLQDGLERSGLFQAVLPSTSLLGADLRLETTLYDFSHHMLADRKSEAVIRLGFHLMDVRKSRLLASRQFELRMPAPSLDAEGGVAAINAAVASLFPRLIDWLKEALAQP